MRLHHQKGQIVIIAVVFLAIMVSASGVLIGYATLHVRGERQSVAQQQALYIAEAGLEKAIYELNENSGYNGESGTALGNGEMSISVTTISQNNRRISATGYVPNADNPSAIKTVHASVGIDTETVAFNFGVQVGEGGLSMSNGSRIVGNVFSNGNISGSGIITGDVSVGAGTAATADQECTTQSGDFIFANNDTSKREVSQKFTPTTSGALTKVSVYIKRTGNPSGLTARIMPHNSTTNQAQRTGQIGGTGSLTSIGTGYGWVDISFSSSPTLTAGTSYWIVLDGTNNSSTAYYTVGTDSSYACSGDGKYASSYSNNPPNWQPITASPGADVNFKTFMGGTTTTLTGVTVQGNARAQQMSSCTVGQSAYYESASTTCNVTGTQFSGTSAPAPQAMPISEAQITDWKADATAGGTLSGTQNITGSQTMGPKKITGDLNATNGASLYLTGTVWVTGNINLSNNVTVRVDNSLGNNGAIIIADGAINISNNVILNGNNNPNSFPVIISLATGTAMNINNNATGAVFYAANGTIAVSNNGGATQLTGYGISLSNNAVITYTTGLQNASFTNGPGGSWAFIPGTYSITQ